MIKGRVISNVDRLRDLIWPKFFVEVPRKGDRVISSSGIEGFVLYITHCSTFFKDGGDEPYVEIYVDNEYLRK